VDYIFRIAFFPKKVLDFARFFSYISKDGFQQLKMGIPQIEKNY